MAKREEESIRLKFEVRTMRSEGRVLSTHEHVEAARRACFRVLQLKGLRSRWMQKNRGQCMKGVQTEHATTTHTPQGSISEAFEGALFLYVAEEERELLAYMEVGGCGCRPSWEVAGCRAWGWGWGKE